MNIRLFILVLLFISAHYSNAQNTTPTNTWKKRVVRAIELKQENDTVRRHFVDYNPDSTIIERLLGQIKKGKLTAYSTFQDVFTKTLTYQQIHDMLEVKPDTSFKVDPQTGKEMMIVVKREFDPYTITQYRIIEDWIFDPNSGKTNIQLLAIAPVKPLVNDDGTMKGYLPLFWVRYTDIKPIITEYSVYHPNDNLVRNLWDDYFKVTEASMKEQK